MENITKLYRLRSELRALSLEVEQGGMSKVKKVINIF